MAHLKAQETHHDDDERKKWKLYLVRQLYKRGYERDDIINWSLAFLFVVTASAVQKAQKRLKPLLRTPISSAFIVAYPKMWAC